MGFGEISPTTNCYNLLWLLKPVLWGVYMYIISDFIWFIIDKATDKIADYIKYKELEKRIKIKY